MASKMDVALYGHEIAQKMDALTKAPADIDSKYRSYFDSMKSRYAKKDEDTSSRLSEFTLIQWNRNGASIAFPHELRPDIEEECKAAFHRIVG